MIVKVIRLNIRDLKFNKKLLINEIKYNYFKQWNNNKYNRNIGVISYLDKPFSDKPKWYLTHILFIHHHYLSRNALFVLLYAIFELIFFLKALNLILQTSFFTELSGWLLLLLSTHLVSALSSMGIQGYFPRKRTSLLSIFLTHWDIQNWVFTPRYFFSSFYHFGIWCRTILLMCFFINLKLDELIG